MIVGAEIETVAWFESESSQGKDAIYPSDAGIIKEIHEMARAALGRTSRFDRGIAKIVSQVVV